MAETITQFALVFSLSSNVYLFLLLRRQQKQPKKLDVGAQELLHDLTAKGLATVRIEVVDSSKFLLWRG